MRVKIIPQIGDDIPLILFESHELGAIVKGEHPCSLCRDLIELNKSINETTLIRDHFHGSDFGSCRKKVFNIMKTGLKQHSSNLNFLNDGHLHEASIMQNLIAGLPEKFKLSASANAHEYSLNVLGFQIIGHTDGLLIDKDNAYLIECKAVKDYTWRKVKEGNISDEWYGQMQAYMLMLNIDRAYLIVKHRETSKILQPIRIDKDNTFIATRLNVLKDIHTRIISGDGQPNREHKNHNNSECKFCIFGNEIGNKTCWSNEDED